MYYNINIKKKKNIFCKKFSGFGNKFNKLNKRGFLLTLADPRTLFKAKTINSLRGGGEMQRKSSILSTFALFIS